MAPVNASLTQQSHAPAPAPAPAPRRPGDLLQLRGMDAAEIRALLAETRRYAQAPADQRWDTLRGVMIATMFLEDSTRTRLSFAVAARRLGAEVHDLGAPGSSITKGETLEDTARVLEAQGFSVFVVRSRAPGQPHAIARAVRGRVLNAGDGRHEHPTQGLLDAYTLAEAAGRLDSFDLTGLRVAIVGDIANSRVARSDVAAMTALGAEVVCVGPPALAPRSIEALGCAVSHDFDEVLPGVDAVQMLRVQAERGAAAGSLREYTDAYQLDEARAARMRRGAWVMHPGPMNRGVEIASAVADGPRSLIFRQDAVGVFVRMAALAQGAAQA